jgi:hypothetical protein
MPTTSLKHADSTPNGPFVYSRVQGIGLSLQPVAAVVGGLNTSGTSKCNTADEVVAAGAAPQPQAGNHTVEHIEEIVPELEEYRYIDHSDDKARLKAGAGIQ